MAITRTIMVDDDGTGTTGTILNNAWLQTIYNQIDAADAAGDVASTPIYGTLAALADASGAGLVFPTKTGTWAKYGKLVFFWLQVVYPATANGANAVISGLSHVVRSTAGASQGYGVQRIWNLGMNSNTLIPYNPTTAASVTNATMSGSNVIVSGVYLTD